MRLTSVQWTASVVLALEQRAQRDALLSVTGQTAAAADASRQMTAKGTVHWLGGRWLMMPLTENLQQTQGKRTGIPTENLQKTQGKRIGIWKGILRTPRTMAT
jgi:hypothetical protein